MIELQDVTKRYVVGREEISVLQDVTLTIHDGEFVSIMGPSGSGKSTMMHIMGCLDVPSSGRYLLDGRRMDELSPTEMAHVRNRKIGFVFQNFHLLPRMTALQNVELPMAYAGVGRAKRRKEAERRLAEVGLENRLTHLPSALSGGQRQRVAIARALVNEPSVLLADEPTGALDSSTGQDIMSLFQSLNKTGVTVVVITHDPSVAEYAGRIVRLFDGRIVADHVAGGSRP